MVEVIPEFSYQVSPVQRRGTGGRNLRQQVHFIFADLGEADRETAKEGVADLCSLVAARNAETPEKPVPDDFPVFVAPITKVAYPRGNPTEFTVSLDPDCLGTKAADRDARVREFCNAIGSFVLDIDDEPEAASATQPAPGITELDPVAEASAGVASAPPAPIVKGFERLVLGPVRAG